MRMSRGFMKTFREDVGKGIGEDVGKGIELAKRAGVFCEITPGHPFLSPIGLAVIRRLEETAREELNLLSAEEVSLPLWVSREHHEIVLDVTRRFVQSYKELSRLLFSLRKEARSPLEKTPLREKEGIKLRIYSLREDQSTAELFVDECMSFTKVILEKCGLEDRLIRTDSVDGFSASLIIESSNGGLEMLFCKGCGKAYVAELAPVQKILQGAEPDVDVVSKDMDKVFTPGVQKIADLCSFLKVEPHRCLKTVLCESSRGVVVGVIRGDLDVSMEKLTRAAGRGPLKMASEEVILQHGMVPGFAAPLRDDSKIRSQERADSRANPVVVSEATLSVQKNIVVVIDDSVDLDEAYVAGANELDYHFVGIVPRKDFPDRFIVQDITAPSMDSVCPGCGAGYEPRHGWVIGEFQEVTSCFAEKAGVSFMQVNGKPAPVEMGWLSIDLSAILETVMEIKNDESGMVWPDAIAPFDVHVLRLGKPGSEEDKVCLSLIEDLENDKLRVLWDDRKESPGVKFNDADLLGIPWRVVVSAKNLKNGEVELKKRDSNDKEMIALGEVSVRISK